MGNIERGDDRDAPRHGLPDSYPFNEPGFRADQAASAKWYRFTGPTREATAAVLQVGEVYELWPGGTLFNASGTCIGQLNIDLPPTGGQ